MMLEGNLLKMNSETGKPVQYSLPLGSGCLPLNLLLGKRITLEFTGQINCIGCGKLTKTSFSQGYCYNCLQTAPETSESVMRPELSKAHLGIARDMAWAREHDLIDHIVYLAASSDLKVGVTRHHQIPVRWIDQGASSAIAIARTPNRHIAGIIEVWLKQFYTDKTNWREMLQNKNIAVDLEQERDKAIDLLTPELRKYAYRQTSAHAIEYPVLQYPQKVTSLSFDKSPVISGALTGIKGQYLIFDDGQVLNIRKHNGYFIKAQSI